MGREEESILKPGNWRGFKTNARIKQLAREHYLKRLEKKKRERQEREDEVERGNKRS